MISWLLKPSNIIIMILCGVIFLLYSDLQVRKVQLADCRTETAECKGDLGICKKDTEQFQGEVTSLNGIIEKLNENITDIKKQMLMWREIAKEADGYAKRLLAAAESRTSCEVYHAENAKIAVDITNDFNRSFVRGKVSSRPASAGDNTAGQVLPPARSSGVAQPSDNGGKDLNSSPAR